MTTLLEKDLGLGDFPLVRRVCQTLFPVAYTAYMGVLWVQ
jgi:hypothetical protein